MPCPDLLCGEAVASGKLIGPIELALSTARSSATIFSTSGRSLSICWRGYLQTNGGSAPETSEFPTRPRRQKQQSGPRSGPPRPADRYLPRELRLDRRASMGVVALPKGPSRGAGLQSLLQPNCSSSLAKAFPFRPFGNRSDRAAEPLNVCFDGSSSAASPRSAADLIVAYNRSADGGRDARKIAIATMTSPAIASAPAGAHCLSRASSVSRGPRRSSPVTGMNWLTFSAAGRPCPPLGCRRCDVRASAAVGGSARQLARLRAQSGATGSMSKSRFGMRCRMIRSALVIAATFAHQRAVG